MHYSSLDNLQYYINFLSAVPREYTTIGNFHAQISNTEYAICLHHTWSRIDVMVEIARVCPIKERNQTFVQNYFGSCKNDCIKAIMNFYKEHDMKN